MMTAFRAAFANEVVRLFRPRKVVISILFDAAVCLAIWLSVFITKKTAQFTLTDNPKGIILSVFCLYLVPLFVIAETMDVFRSSYNNKTIVGVLIRPISRLKIYFSKIAAIGAFVLLHFAVVTVAANILDFTSVSSVLTFVLSVIITLLPMLALAAVVAFISEFVKNAVIGTLISVVLLIVAKIAEVLFITPSAFLFTTYFDFYKMFITANIRPLHIINTFILLGAYFVFAFFGGFALFDKKEF